MRRRRKIYLTDAPDLEWCGQYILGGEDGRTPVPCYSLLEWGRWLESSDRIVARTGKDLPLTLPGERTNRISRVRDSR